MQVSEELRSRASILSKRVIDDMYRNPFWESRFAARGRQHAEQDAQYHVTYLATAVEMESPSTMATYAVWLRSVLTSRGMCSRHLDENFERIADAIAFDDTLSREPLTIGCLEAARNALLYEDTIARELQSRECEVADRVIANLRHVPEYRSVPGINTADDIRYIVSFIADAVVQETSNHLTGHFQWMHSYASTVIDGDVQLHLVLDQLDVQFSMLSDGAQTCASQLLHAARTVIPGRPS